MIYKSELDLIAEAYEQMKEPKQQITEMAWGIGANATPINSSQIMDKVYALELQGGGSCSVTMVSLASCPANKNVNKEKYPLFPIYKVSFAVAEVGGKSYHEKIDSHEQRHEKPEGERYEKGTSWSGGAEKFSQNQMQYTKKDGETSNYLAFDIRKDSPIKKPKTVFVTGAGGNFRAMTEQEVAENKCVRPPNANQANNPIIHLTPKPQTVVGITTKNEEGKSTNYINTDATPEQLKALEVAKAVNNMA